jgi:hypothetical protein
MKLTEKQHATRVRANSFVKRVDKATDKKNLGVLCHRDQR